MNDLEIVDYFASRVQAPPTDPFKYVNDSKDAELKAKLVKDQADKDKLKGFIDELVMRNSTHVNIGEVINSLTKTEGMLEPIFLHHRNKHGKSAEHTENYEEVKRAIEKLVRVMKEEISYPEGQNSREMEKRIAGAWILVSAMALITLMGMGARPNSQSMS